jgi:hypothetical protein
MDLGAPLTDQYLARFDVLAPESLYSKPFRSTIASILSAAATLFMSHI